MPTTDARHHFVPAIAETVHWGYFSKSLEPVAYGRIGRIVTIETLTHHADDDHARMIAGDPGAESVFRWTKEGKGVDRRGAGPLDASIHGAAPAKGSACTSVPARFSCAGPSRATCLRSASSTCGRGRSATRRSPGAPSAATPPPGGAFTTTIC